MGERGDYLNMAIERLGNIYGIPAIKKEEEPVMNQRRKQKKDSGKGKKRENDEKGKKQGKIDIRI